MGRKPKRNHNSMSKKRNNSKRKNNSKRRNNSKRNTLKKKNTRKRRKTYKRNRTHKKIKIIKGGATNTDLINELDRNNSSLYTQIIDAEDKIRRDEIEQAEKSLESATTIFSGTKEIILKLEICHDDDTTGECGRVTRVKKLLNDKNQNMEELKKGVQELRSIEENMKTVQGRIDSCYKGVENLDNFKIDEDRMKKQLKKCKEKHDREIYEHLCQQSASPIQSPTPTDMMDMMDIILFDQERPGLLTPLTEKNWESCESGCNTFMQDIYKKNKEYTWFWILYFNEALIRFKETAKLKLSNVGERARTLTGIWSHDSEILKVHIILDEDGVEKHQDVSILNIIMGPSASGKTFSTKGIAAAIGNSDGLTTLVSKKEGENKLFAGISCDGGIFREVSMFYNLVVYSCNKKDKKEKIKKVLNKTGETIYTINGIKKLSSIFNTDILKRDFSTFLSQPGHGKISIFIPDTLTKYMGTGADWGLKAASAGIARGTRIVLAETRRSSGYQHSLEDVIDYFMDTPLNFRGICTDGIGSCIFVYQHKTPEDCPYNDEFKCKGVIESGKNREITEGKEYSDSSWETAMNIGNDLCTYGDLSTHINSGSIWKIHNSGDAARISTLTAYGETSDDCLSQLETSFRTQDMDKYGAYRYLKVDPDAVEPVPETLEEEEDWDEDEGDEDMVWTGGRGSDIC